MLIKCPKCGFVQPSDQFCARCGIDVHLFQQKPAPLIQRIIGHPAFWAGLFILVVIGTFGYLKYEKQSELAQRRVYLKKGPQFVNTKSHGNKDLKPQQSDASGGGSVQQTENFKNLNDSLETSEVQKSASSPSPSVSIREATSLGLDQDTDSFDQVKSALHSSQEKISKTLTVLFFEASEEQITQAIETALQKGATPIDFGYYRSTPLFSSLDRPGWVKLKSKRINLSTNSLEFRWVEGSADPEMGFLFALSVNGVTFPLQAELDIVKVIPEDATSELTPIRYPTTVMDILPEQTKWLISLRLPRTVSKEALQILKDPIFSIFSSDSFLKMKSEFTLIFDFGNQ